MVLIFWEAPKGRVFPIPTSRHVYKPLASCCSSVCSSHKEMLKRMLSNSNRDSSKEVAVIRGEGSGSGSGSRSESRERRHRLLLYFKQPPVLNRIVRFYSNSFSCRSMQHTFRTEHTIPAFNISLPCPLRSLLELSPCILQVDCELSIYFFIFIGCCYYYQEI